jgi:hemerythrin
MTINTTNYSIGIASMDTQHALLIRIIDEFMMVSSAQYLEQAGTDAAIRTLEQLLKYAGTHFESEELFIAAHNYPGTEAHKKQHHEIEAGIVQLLDEIRAQRSPHTPLKLNFFVTVWLLEHVQKEDGKYARFVLDKPVYLPMPAPAPPRKAQPETGRPLLSLRPAGPDLS